MRPRETIYRLAYSSKDYQRCHALVRVQGEEDFPFSWPTIMALRGDVLRGILGTVPSEHAVVAGPLVVTPARPLITIIRLIEAYELVLWKAGVRSYYFRVLMPQGKPWLALLDKAGLMPYAQEDTGVWFRRQMGG